MTGDTYQTLADRDPAPDFDILTVAAAAYGDPADRKNPCVSPICGYDAKGYPQREHGADRAPQKPPAAGS